MTEQDLTALAKERSHPSAAETASEYSLAHGYLTRLAERDAAKNDIRILTDRCMTAMAERDALQAQLEQYRADDRWRANQRPALTP